MRFCADLDFRFAYRKALAIIRTVPFKIESPEDINNITGIGKKIKEKIQEIVSTGKLKKAEILTVNRVFCVYLILLERYKADND